MGDLPFNVPPSEPEMRLGLWKGIARKIIVELKAIGWTLANGT